MWSFKKSKGVLGTFSICSASYSPGFRTSKTMASLWISCAKNSAVTDSNVSISLPDVFHASKPPLKYPNTLSNPTRDNLVIVSFSIWSGTTRSMGWSISFTRDPTQGAKVPPNPINIDWGIKPLTNSNWWRTSIITASVSLATNSKSSTDSAFAPVFITSSIDL